MSTMICGGGAGRFAVQNHAQLRIREGRDVKLPGKEDYWEKRTIGIGNKTRSAGAGRNGKQDGFAAGSRRMGFIIPIVIQIGYICITVRGTVRATDTVRRIAGRETSGVTTRMTNGKQQNQHIPQGIEQFRGRGLGGTVCRIFGRGTAPGVFCAPTGDR